jgi:hypothetical protein
MPTREAIAATIVQDQKFGLLGFFSDATLNYILFDPSLGTLTGIEYVLTSEILEPVGTTLLASVSSTHVFAVVLTGPSPGTPITFNSTVPVDPPGFALFLGIGSFPINFDYFAGCSPCSGTGWSGDLMLTYTYDAAAVPEVPLPAALPLFATGLGALGLLGGRRKKKAAAPAG